MHPHIKHYERHTMKKFNLARVTTLLLLTLSSNNMLAEDKIELDTTFIKGNTELPKILYVVPWQDKLKSKVGEQKLVLHSLFGDIFEPIAPDPPKNRSGK